VVVGLTIAQLPRGDGVLRAVIDLEESVQGGGRAIDAPGGALGSRNPTTFVAPSSVSL